MVFIMTAAASIFFLISDQIMRLRRDLHHRLGRLTATDASIMSKRWYIVQAYSNFEQKVADLIREQAKQRHLEHCFDEILVPKEKVVEVRRGRKVDAERKFFPGYVLVKMDLTDEAYHLIKNTPKVTGFLGTDNKPMPITRDRGAAHPAAGAGGYRPAEAVDLVRDRRAGAGLGRAVRLVQRHRRGSRRCALAAQGGGVIFGRATPVELEFGQVEKL